jgi:ATP-dependent DNA helicase RecG
MNVKPSVTAAENGLTHEERVKRFIVEHGFITRKQTENLLNISQTAAGVVLRQMVKGNTLLANGNSRNVRYFPING